MIEVKSIEIVNAPIIEKTQSILNEAILNVDCNEISLRAFQFCNLCEVNVSNIESQNDLNERVKAATLIGTLQASYTDFHYLRDIWKETTEKEALLGIGMTGIGSGEILKYNCEEAAKIAMKENERIAKLIGIKKAARITTVKPSGTSSTVLGTSSGIHAWHDKYYVRRIRIGKDESIYSYLKINHPEVLEDDYFKPKTDAIISIPQKAPDNAIFRTETALDLLERVKLFNQTWIVPGHRKGPNTHNISCTVSIDKDRYYTQDKDGKFKEFKPVGIDDAFDEKFNEWEVVGKWMWDNRNFYNGLSVLPFDGGSYVQAPFESMSKEKYDEMFNHLHDIDLTKIIENDDNTNLQGEVACSGNSCEIK